MMLRSVNTKIWEDAWFETLSPNEKLLFLYLLTNKNTNIAGIYETSLRRISFETGLDDGTIRNGFERFEMVCKAFFILDSFVVLPNFLKHQRLNKNMEKSVVKTVNQLPDAAQEAIFGNHYLTIRNGYSTIRNTLLKYEIGKRKKEERNIHDVYLPTQNNFPEKKSTKKQITENSKAVSVDKKNDFLDSVISVFSGLYLQKYRTEYILTAKGKERQAVGRLLVIMKQKFPDANSDEMINKFRELFQIAMETNDDFIQKNMSVSIITSQFNKIKLLHNGTRTSLADKARAAAE